MRNKWQHYREEEILSILRDYYNSGMSKRGLFSQVWFN